MKIEAFLIRFVLLIFWGALVACQQEPEQELSEVVVSTTTSTSEPTQPPPKVEVAAVSPTKPPDKPEPTKTTTPTNMPSPTSEAQDISSSSSVNDSEQGATAGSHQFTAEEMFELIMAKEVDIEPIILEEPDIQTVTIYIERVPLPAENLTRHATVQYVEGLIFDDAGQLWAKMPDGYVLWNIEAGTYEWDEAPEEIVTTLGGSSALNCTEIAVEAGLEDAEYQFFPACLPGTDEGSYWFASFEDGIRYFDGENWTHYTTENGLISDEVSDLALDTNGKLWASTFGGVAVFEDGSWSDAGVEVGLVKPVMTAIAVDKQGNIWVGARASRVLQFDGETWTTHEINITGAVTDIRVDSKGGLWIPDNQSQTLFELEHDKWREHDFDPEDNISEFSSVYVSEVEKAPDGNIWLATSGTGLFRIGQDEVRWYCTENGLASNFVNDLSISVDGSIWLATGGGISHFDGSTWQTFTLSEGPGISYPMSAFSDSGGSVWFGAIDGVAKLGEDGNWQTFSNFTPLSGYLPTLSSITESSDEEVYGAGCAGVYKYGDEGWEVVLEGPLAAYEKPLFERIFIPWCVTEIAIADNDTIWVNQMDIPQDHAHGVLQIFGDDYNWYSTPYITAILPRENDDVWFGTKEGVLTYAGDVWGKLPESVFGEYSWITTAMTGPNGEAWFGTPVGFASFDGQLWTNYEFSDSSELDLFAMTFDNKGTVWLSTLEGVGRFDGENLLLYEYGEIDPNPFAEITRPSLIGTSMVGVGDSIAFGPDGALWMSFGPSGIIRFEVPPS